VNKGRKKINKCKNLKSCGFHNHDVHGNVKKTRSLLGNRAQVIHTVSKHTATLAVADYMKMLHVMQI
jgi:hypothetical protein